jgi:hypothetical protein
LITLAPLLTFLAVDKALRLHDHVPRTGSRWSWGSSSVPTSSFDAFCKDAFCKDILRGAGAPSMDELVPRLCKDAKIMRSIDDFEPGTPEELFFSRMAAMDTTTLLPIALFLFPSGELEPDRRRPALWALESWLVRRAILRLTAKNYNRTLTSLLKAIKEDVAQADEAVVRELRSSQASTAVWPSDDQVSQRLENGEIHGYVGQPRVRIAVAESGERPIERHVTVAAKEDAQDRRKSVDASAREHPGEPWPGSGRISGHQQPCDSEGLSPRLAGLSVEPPSSSAGRSGKSSAEWRNRAASGACPSAMVKPARVQPRRPASGRARPPARTRLLCARAPPGQEECRR